MRSHEAVMQTNPRDVATGAASTSLPTETTMEPQKHITGGRLLAVISSVTLVAFLIMLDQAILGTAIPQITSQFHSLPDVGWYTGVYPLASAALQPLSGKLYTHFRVKYIFLAFLMLFELGSLICGVAPSSTALIVGRAIAGLGSAGLTNGAMTIIAGATPMAKRALYTGLMLGVSSLGIVLGPLVGGALTEYATWRWCFYINLPIGGCAALCLLLIRIPELTAKEAFSLKLVRKVLPELDLVGFAMFAPAAIMFLLALQFGSEKKYSWDDPVIIGLLCGAGVTAIIFCVWEFRVGERAMVPWYLIRQRVVYSSTLVNVFLISTVVIGSNYLPIYFQAVKGVGPSRSGVYMLPSILTQLFSAVISGAAVSKLGYYLPWAMSSTAIAAIGNGLISTFSPDTNTGTWIGFQLILGVGRGCGIQMPAIAVQNALPPAQIPVSLAILMFTQNLAASVFFAIATTIFTETLVDKLGEYAPSVAPEEALKAGGSAGAVRALVPPGSLELHGVLTSYAKACDAVFIMLAALAAVAFVSTWGMGWKNVSKTESKSDRAEKQEKHAG